MMPPTRPATRRLLAAALLSGAALWAAAPAGAQDMGSLLNRLNRLENEVDTLNRQVYRGAAPPPVPGAPTSAMTGNLAADFEVRLTRLEREIATVNGRNEEIQYGLTQVRQRLEKLQEDLELRFQELEQKLGTASAEPPRTSAAQAAPPAQARPPQQAAAQPARPEPQGQLPAGNAQEQYDRAYQLLTKSDYASAERAFEQFIKANPGHALASNAQYWLAETYYARKMYQQAAQAYGEAYQKAPKGPKAPDNLLKLGMSLGALNRKDDACLALAQLNKLTDAPATVRRRAEQERGRFNCT